MGFKRQQELRAADKGPEKPKVPDTCMVCGESFKQPVVTKCNHFFCESCALKNHAKTKKCAECGAKTEGVFNNATKVLAELKKKADAHEEDSDSISLKQTATERKFES